MNANTLPTDQHLLPTPSYPLLEWITAVVLMLVMASLAWMATADYLPTSWRLLAIEFEIVIVLALLTVSLLLVSILALLQTK